MKQKYRLIGVVLLVLVVAALVILPGGKDLDKYQEMMQRESFEDVSRSLSKELRLRPNWHEARVLLITSELKLSRPSSAILHMTELAEAGYEMLELERAMMLWLDYNQVPEDQVQSTVKAARLGVERCPEWDWIHGIYLLFSVRYDSPEDLLAALEMYASPQVIEGASQGTTTHISAAIHKLVAAGESEAAWGLALKLEQIFTSWCWRDTVISSMENEGVTANLDAQFPHDPLLAVAAAGKMTPEEGLAFLRQWEQENEVDENSFPHYQFRKHDLIDNAESLLQADLNYSDPYRLVETAFTGHSEKNNVIIKYLEERGYRELAQEAKKIVGGLNPLPNSTMYLPHEFVSLSPDGEMLISQMPNMMDTRSFLLTNEAGDEKELFQLAHRSDVAVYWSPDSRNVIVQSQENFIGLFSAQGEPEGHALDEYNDIIIGWSSPNTIIVRTPGKSTDNLYEYNVSTQEIQPCEVDFYDELQVGPKGALAWIYKNKTWVQKDGNLTAMPFSTALVSWSPDGNALLVDRGSRLCVWNGDVEEVIIKGKFLGWRTNTTFYWTEGSYDRLGSGLMTYNIKTGEYLDFEFLGNWEAAAGKTVVSSRGTQGFRVYALP